MIVVIMGMIERRGNQRDQHRDHTQTCAKPLHIGDSYVPGDVKSTASPQMRLPRCPEL